MLQTSDRSALRPDDSHLSASMFGHQATML
jgi:hypothetical protein